MFVPINGAPNLPNPNETPTKIPVHPKTDIWRKPPSINTFNAPCYILHMPAESFLRARVSVKGDWKRLYDQGGLVLFLPGWPNQEVWIKAGVEFNDGTPWVSTVAGRDGGDWSLFPAPNGGKGEVTVEIEREDEGTDTSLWVYLVEGEKRTAVREVTWVFKEEHVGGNISIGIYAARPTQLSDGDNEELSVEFSALQHPQMGQTASHSSPSTTNSSGCPIDHKGLQTQQKCPVDHQSQPAPAKCPVEHSSSNINPLNQMPTDLANNASSSYLPTDREASTIPRNSDGETWEYPSPQQFHTALARKGMETPEEHVEMMVAIHNWLNEAAWNEVLKWEQKSNPDNDKVQLARLRGRPGELSPKARLFMLAGWLLPSRFNTEPPFDRHDWVIRRSRTNEEVRYVIDYYSAPPEPDGSPAFFLDVRPALDSFSSIRTRISMATEETWTQFRTRNANKT